MGQTTGIEWTDHSFNPWRGCTKVSAGCEHCYAETLSKRNPKTLGTWGPRGVRVVAAESYWRQPLKWNREAEAAGERRRVFCASLADVFEDWTGPIVHGGNHRPAEVAITADAVFDEAGPRQLTMQDLRRRLFQLIDNTFQLDWLLLTKRPENIRRLIPGRARCAAWPDCTHPQCEADHFYANVWLGISVEDQATADERVPILLDTPAAVRFVSCEPMLSMIDLSEYLGHKETNNERSGKSISRHARARAFPSRREGADLESEEIRGGKPLRIAPGGARSSKVATGGYSNIRQSSDEQHGLSPSDVHGVREAVESERSPRRLDDLERAGNTEGNANQPPERERRGQSAGESGAGYAISEHCSRDKTSRQDAASLESESRGEVDRTASSRDSGFVGEASDESSRIGTTVSSDKGNDFGDCAAADLEKPSLDWVICGCESGPKRRPMERSWAESVVNQCRDAGVPVFVKQLEIDGKVTGDVERFPEALRVREFPEPARVEG